MDQLVGFSQSLIEQYGDVALFILTAGEQFVFPVPADPFIAAAAGSGMPMLKLMPIVFFSTMLGATITYFFGKYVGHPGLEWLFGKTKLQKGERAMERWGIWAVIVAGLTPLPFKAVAALAGAFEMPFKKYIVGVILGRMPRYFFMAYIANFLIEKQLITGKNTSALILGLTQGITEFLPISSSGHLVVLQEFLTMPIATSDLLTFDIFLHGGSLAAIVLYFWKDWLKVIKELFGMVKNLKLKTDSLSFKLAVGTLPAIFAALLFEDQISSQLRNLTSVSIFFIIIGCLYFYTSWKGKKNHIQTVGLKKSILIGFAQAAALIPGVSRAGSTIAMGVSLGIKRDVAAKFSFMLGGIAILAANIYALIGISEATLPPLDFVLTGAITSFISSFGAIYLLLKFLQKYTMRAFGVYLILAGVSILSFLA